MLRIAVRAGDGADFPWGNRVEAVLFQPRGWDALSSSGEGPSEKWMVASSFQRNFFSQPMAREPNKFGIDDSLCLYVDHIVYTLF